MIHNDYAIEFARKYADRRCSPREADSYARYFAQCVAKEQNASRWPSNLDVFGLWARINRVELLAA